MDYRDLVLGHCRAGYTVKVRWWVGCWKLKSSARQSGRKDGGEVGEAGKNEIYEAELEVGRKDCNISQDVTTSGSCNNASDRLLQGKPIITVTRASPRHGSSYCQFWLTEDRQQRTLRVILTNAFLTDLVKRVCSGCSRDMFQKWVSRSYVMEEDSGK